MNRNDPRSRSAIILCSRFRISRRPHLPHSKAVAQGCSWCLPYICVQKGRHLHVLVSSMRVVSKVGPNQPTRMSGFVRFSSSPRTVTDCRQLP